MNIIFNNYIKITVTVLTILSISGCGTPAVIQSVDTKQVKKIKLGDTAKPVQLKKIVIKLKRGQHIGAAELGIFCAANRDITWKGGRFDITNDEFTDAFRQVLEKNGYKVAGDPDALFEDPSSWKAEILIAGLVNDLKANICYPYGGFGNYDTAKGEAFIQVEWHIYSRLRREVIHKVLTKGDSKITDSIEGGETNIILIAFEEAANNLLADETFYSLITNSKHEVANIHKKERFKPLTIKTGPLRKKLKAKSLAVSRENVVTIFAGDGHGSGFIISNSGYILSNAHVVGGATYVAVRLHSGKELVGKVIRTNKQRDVALIKVPKGLSSHLVVRIKPGRIGEDVFAIGAPLDEKYSSTLSKGIISSYRKEDGLDYMQSDVNVLPGNSGGPLVDISGNVLGISVSGIIFRGTPSGVNFFIPIYSALDSLSLTIK